jgi:hypothetical protein
VVWKQGPDRTLIPVEIRTGLTDHTVTEVAEVVRGELKAGDELIIGSTSLASSLPAPGIGAGRTRRR